MWSPVCLPRFNPDGYFYAYAAALDEAPLTLILPAVGMGVDGVFLAEPISNVLGGLACILAMYLTVYRRLRE